MNATSLSVLLDGATLAAVTAAASNLLVLCGSVIDLVPGLRPADQTRSTLLRVLLFGLTLGGVLFLAWSQNVVITRDMVPTLLGAIAGSDLLAHISYTAIKNKGASGTPSATDLAMVSNAAAAALAATTQAAQA